MVKVSVIICSWNGKHLLAPCLKSLQHQSFTNFETIIVDNGSTDGTQEFLKKKYPWVRIVHNQTNLGFAAGNNTGIYIAKGAYIALLNNDAIADKDWLAELVNTLEKDKSLFGVASIADQKYWKKRYWFPGFGTTCFFGQTTIDKRIPKQHKGLVDIWSPGGGASLLRKPDTDLFDPDYFMYGEDTWYGFKMRLQGFHAVLNPASKVIHEGEASSKRMPNWKIFYQERNRLLNTLIAYQPTTLLKLTPLLILNLIAILLYDLTNAHIRIFAHMWLITHPIAIWKKRVYLQSFRIVDDDAIIKYLSGKFYEEQLINNRFLRTLIQTFNWIQLGYCSIVNLKTTEFYTMKKGRLQS
ncbi:MAG: glycosyltransferase family 2 protein [Nanoarchaeota archaeon]